MAHDVFISYSSKDMAAGEAVCAALEGRGLRCWIAPRDIVPGIGWAKSIVRAIGQARTMVMVFSENANSSPQIEREVDRAVNKGIPIIPLRIENVQPGEALEYFLSSPHWLDAFKPPLGQHLDRLAEAVQALLGSDRVASGPAEAVAVSVGTPAEPVKMPPRANPKTSRPRTTEAPGAIFSGVQGSARNLVVVAALTSVAAVVALLSAGVIAASAFF
jgi:hypothetical protein